MLSFALSERTQVVADGVDYLDGERGDSYNKEFVTIVSFADLRS
jgi:hypothetical protein